MDAPLAVPGTLSTRVDPRLPARLAQGAAWCTFALIVCGALVLLARRISGALVEPLAGPWLLGLGLLLALATIAYRRSLPAQVESAPPLARLALHSAPPLVLALWAIGLLLPGTQLIAMLGFVGSLVVEEAWSWQALLRHRTPPLSEPHRERSQPLEVPTTQPLSNASIEESDLCDPDVSQRIVRRRNEHGAERIEGYLLAEFQPGERQVMAHLAICPPLARVPICDAEQAAGPDASVKVAQVLPYGVRFEVKLDEPAPEAAAVSIEFVVREHPAA